MSARALFGLLSGGMMAIGVACIVFGVISGDVLGIAIGLLNVGLGLFTLKVVR